MRRAAAALLVASLVLACGTAAVLKKKPLKYNIQSVRVFATGGAKRPLHFVTPHPTPPPPDPTTLSQHRVEGKVNVHIVPHTHDDVGEEASRAQPRPTPRSSPHPAAPKRKTSNRPFPPTTVPRRVA